MAKSVTEAFSALSEQAQTTVLAAYAHELTVAARAGYEPGTELLSDPGLLRRLNELQHRISAAIFARLTGGHERYPDAVLIEIITGPPDLRHAFQRAWKTAFGTDLQLES